MRMLFSSNYHKHELGVSPCCVLCTHSVSSPAAVDYYVSTCDQLIIMPYFHQQARGQLYWLKPFVQCWYPYSLYICILKYVNIYLYYHIRSIYLFFAFPVVVDHLSCCVLFCPIMSHTVPCVMINEVLPCRVSSCRVLSCPILSCPAV